ncbi:hypothetical protein [Haloplanus sp.]|uniref:hypothetical protein n=1 Tax=Haloplanus sp. TaxID=1961696 RepID=UPI00263152BC|nr:hypothetical protein [Haloplanus sp.]
MSAFSLPVVPAFVVSAFSLLLAGAMALRARPTVAVPSPDTTPAALLTGPSPVPPSVVLTGGAGLGLLLTVAVIGPALLTARTA